ncbi:hypothetical protein [Azohydromonas lata]|uniref:DUF3108 domain-containing protein n=1 Tax=Azohydromonas lata TaxID=45677 RepID=A0ABU5IGW3_9BURK|nr:hypothetical protein [Azohydromonas lata]MDZ5457173.1 hypothetical protein [Azohydromonas lata]
MRAPSPSSNALHAALAAAALALLAGCGARSPGADLFPLESGHRWTYEVRTDWEDQRVERETRVFESLGRDDTLASGQAWLRRSDAGMDYWLRTDESGIYRVASRSLVQAEPQDDDTRRYVLKAPLAVGTQWAASTVAYLLQRRQGFPAEVRHGVAPVLMNYAIEATGQAVDTRAGHFEGCLRVGGKAALKLFADPVSGWKDLPLLTTEWYCPAVGLVKLQREESAGSPMLLGGTLTMELLSWQ